MLKLFEDYKYDVELFKKYNLDITLYFNGVYNGDIDLRHLRLQELPDFKIHTCRGNFACSGNTYLKSLKNVPTHILGDFDCSSCGLIDLEFGPRTVGGDYNCAFNKIKSLKSPLTNFKGTFKCTGNFIASLEHCPDGCDDIILSFNRITSLDYTPNAKRLTIADNYLLSKYTENKNIIIKYTSILDKNHVLDLNSIDNDDLIFCFELLEPHQIQSQLLFFKNNRLLEAYQKMFDVLKIMGYDYIENDDSELF
jgi:hypothetical protein